MEAAFIVKLDIPDTSAASLAGLAEDIQDSLQTDGLPVLTVTPWTRPTNQLSVPAFGTETQETQTNTDKLNQTQKL